MNKRIEELLNAQIEKEGYSSLLYLSMGSWCEINGFPGVSKWLYAHAEEEHIHMIRLMHYVNDRGGHALVPAFKKPPFDFGTVHEMFNLVYAHEQHITQLINRIVGACIEEKEYTTHQWIQWYVLEQIEEENSVRQILEKLKLSGDNNLYFFDKDLNSSTDTSKTEVAPN